MAKAVNVDFSDVKERGAFNPKQVEEGDYAARIVKVEDAEIKGGDNAGKHQYVFTIKLKKYSQYSYPYRCQTEAKDQLWKLRNIAVAAGMNVPKSRTKFDPNKLVNKEIGVTMEDGDVYNGRTKSEVQAVFPVAELADGAGVDDQGTTDDDFDAGSVDIDYGDADDTQVAKSEKPKGKKSKGKKKKDVQDLDITDV